MIRDVGRGVADGGVDGKEIAENHDSIQMAAHLTFLILLSDSTEADGTSMIVRQNACNNLEGK